MPLPIADPDSYRESEGDFHRHPHNNQNCEGDSLLLLPKVLCAKIPPEKTNCKSKNFLN